MKLRHDTAEAHAVTGLDRPGDMRDEHVAAHLCPVRAAQVLDGDYAILAHFQARVLARDGLVGQQDIGALPADHVQAEAQPVASPPRLFQPGSLIRVRRAGLVGAVHTAQGRQQITAFGAIGVCRPGPAQKDGALRLGPHRATRAGTWGRGRQDAGQQGRPTHRRLLIAAVGERLTPNGPVIVGTASGGRQHLMRLPEIGGYRFVVQVFLHEPPVGLAYFGHAAPDGHF